MIGTAHSKFMNLKFDTISMIIGATDVELDFYLGKISAGPAYYELDLELLAGNMRRIWWGDMPVFISTELTLTVG